MKTAKYEKKIQWSGKDGEGWRLGRMKQIPREWKVSLRLKNTTRRDPQYPDAHYTTNLATTWIILSSIKSVSVYQNNNKKNPSCDISGFNLEVRGKQVIFYRNLCQYCGKASVL